MNKMFKKILAVVAALATAASLSVSAFASGETAEHSAGSVSVTGYAGVAGATQYTVMVFEDSFTSDYDTDKIYYINQGAGLELLLGGMLVKATDGENALPDGDYTVRIGNNVTGVDAVDIDLKVSTVVTPTTKEVTFVWGDINLDGLVNTGDISVILQSSIGGQTTFTHAETGETFTIEDNSKGLLWGDINLDGLVNTGDISVILQSSIGGQTKFNDYTIEQSVTISVPIAQ